MIRLASDVIARGSGETKDLGELKRVTDGAANEDVVRRRVPES